MKFTLSWLKEHLDTDADATTIAARLNLIGLEVEGIEDAGARLKDFVVAEIVSAEKHPQADRLRLCKVNDGNAEIQVVCGAPNARAGIKVILARPGTVIPASGEALKTGTIRGVESRGMLCSAKELLLSEESEGIVELAADAKVGSPVADALGLTDPVIDVSITPNRGDAASVYGIARDLAASGLGKLKTPRVEPVAGKFPSPKKISLDFAPGDEDACPIFAGRLIRGVKNGVAPKWVQDRLKSVGMKSISALVDATNLIAQDRGRPLHVFDADRLTGGLHARMAKPGEKVAALDGGTYALDGETIVIADDAAAQGIAGIMGGADSGCSFETVNVFIESAWFDPARIARAGRKLSIISDARYRFERGVDPQFVLPGLELATRLVLDWCGGEASDVFIAGKLPPPHKAIDFDPGLVPQLGGIDVPRKEIIRILTVLGFTVEERGALHVVPPPWRHDIDGPADLVEEVVRIHGLGHVPSVALMRPHAIARPVLTPPQRRQRAVRRAAAARGFNEAVSFSFVARDQAKLFGGGDEARQLANPIASDLDALRPTPLASLIAAASHNAARGYPELQLFEIGAGFETGMPGGQHTIAAGIRTGEPARSWTKSAHPTDAFDAKADLLALIEAATGVPMTAPVRRGAPAWYHPGRCGALALGPKILGYFGELHPKILGRYDLKGPAAAFELFLDAIPEPKAKNTSPFTPSPYQATLRDLAFVVDEAVHADDVVRAAKGAERHLVETISIFDVYAGKGVPEGKKSVAISMRLQPMDKTLTDAEIEAVAQKIVAAVAKATGATLRA